LSKSRINLWREGRRYERPEAYYDKAADEFVSHGKNFFKQNPSMGAMVLECTGFELDYSI
jgi:hypothetical protein